MFRISKIVFLVLLLSGGFPTLTWAAPMGEKHEATRLAAQTLTGSGMNRKRGLSVTARTLAPRYFTHGSPVVEITLVNEKEFRREVEVLAEQEGSASRTVVLEPHSPVTVALSVPRIGADTAYFHGYSSVADTLAIWLREGDTSWSAGNVESTPVAKYKAERELDLLAGPSLDAIAAAAKYEHEDAADTNKSARAHHNKENFHFHTQAMGSGGWSDDVRAYAGYDLVLLTDAEWTALSPNVRRALVGYAARGGAVVVCGGSRERGATPFAGETAGFQTGDESWSAACRSIDVGDGHFYAVPALGDDRLPPVPRADLERWGETSRELLSDATARNVPVSKLLMAMPDLDLPSVPVSFFLVLMGLFALVVVPVVLTLALRRGRRLLALVVLPLVSFAIGLVAVIGILAVYGVTPRLRVDCAVCLDAADRRALVETKACVLTPRDVTADLRFSRTADVTVVGEKRPGPGEGTRRDLCLESTVGDVRMANGNCWMTTLRPVVYVLSDVIDTNARLMVEEEGEGKLRVTNLLGAALTKLTLVSASGMRFETEALAEGETRELSTSGRDAGLRGGPVAPAQRGHGIPVRPGCYRAEMNAAPFVPDPLGGTTAKRSARTVVWGRYGKEASK